MAVFSRLRERAAAWSVQHPMTDNKPPVLKNPRRMLKLLGVLLGVFVLLYIGVAATAFLRTQGGDDQRSMGGDTQSPVEAAHPPTSG